MYPCAYHMAGVCEPGWKPILEDGAGTPHCALTCQSSSDCPNGPSSCHMGTKAITVAQVGICMYSADSNLLSTIALRVMQIPKQQSLDPSSNTHNLPTSAYLSFLSASLAKNLDKLQKDKGLSKNPEMMAIRIMVAELLEMARTGKQTGGGGGLLGNVEYAADVTIHNVLHPVQFMMDGAPSVLHMILHPFQSRCAFMLLRGLFVILFLYVLIGAAVNAYLYNLTGPALIPHIAFWVEYPQLVQDGWHLLRHKAEFIQANLKSGGGGGNRDAKYLGVRDSFSNFDPLQ